MLSQIIASSHISMCLHCRAGKDSITPLIDPRWIRQPLEQRLTEQMRLMLQHCRQTDRRETEPLSIPEQVAALRMPVWAKKLTGQRSCDHQYISILHVFMQTFCVPDMVQLSALLLSMVLTNGQL